MSNQIQSDSVELQQYIDGINNSIPKENINVTKDTVTTLKGNTKASACIDEYKNAITSFNAELENVVNNLRKAAIYFEDVDNNTAKSMSEIGN